MTRSVLVSALLIAAALFAGAARAEDDTPPVGGVTSPHGAMIFYLAHGQEGVCGGHCSDWIAAEGIIEWDTFKRLLALLERLGDRKLPVVLNVWGQSTLNVAVSLGRIIREHGLDVSVGATVVAGCPNATDAACLGRKRAGKPLDATIDTSSVECDLACVLVLAGGVHRTLPADARVVIGGMHIKNRFAPSVSEAHQRGLQAHYSDQFRLYLTQMGVHSDVIDMMQHNADTSQHTRLSRDDWFRLGIVTDIAD